MLPGASAAPCGYNTEKIQRPGLKIPTLVIHGDSDRMVDVSGGRATAEAVPHAELHIYKGLGHGFPKALWEDMAVLIAENVKRGISG